ncbi:MAG TPA: CPBP family glutamic-type intramembrane protease [Vicinamibacterales bacterium]|nr:CPBP family glutamic-type intramembrane protease [Vicinamibacterales bacterium]
MNAITSWFVGRDGLRGGWRFLAFFVLAIGGGGVVQFLVIKAAGYVPSPGFSSSDLLLADGLGLIAALAAAAVLFGALHYFTKPMETWVDFSTVSLIALFFAFTFLRTGSLWFAAGFHAAFDYAALVVFGGPNSGNEGKPLADRLLATTFHGPDWLTGGSLGPEASFFTFLVIAGLFAAARWRWRHPPAGVRA